MFGIVTRVLLRLIRAPQDYKTLLGIFESVEDASRTVSDIIGAGIVPGALEMMDQLITQAVESAYQFGFPLDAGAVLIVELDGLSAGLERQADQVRRALAAGHDILEKCIEFGGSVTGEHGIGVEKIDFMEKQFTRDDLDAMRALRKVFDPESRCNPHKMFPGSKRCSDFAPRKQIAA